MFGLDEIYIELLNEAKSPEEIRKILYYQFVDSKGVPEDIFNAVLSVDPTKKKNYTRWVLMQWENSAKQISSAVKLGQIEELFNYFKERSGSGLELGNMKSFTDALSAVPAIVKDPIFGIQSNDGGKEDDFDIVYDSPEWRIAVPNTVEASVKLGRGCTWCTAGAYGNAKHYFNRYNERGKLWINFDKRKGEIAPEDSREYPYTRYQFSFEADREPELNDSHNKRIDVDFMDIPESVYEFYGSQNEEYVEILKNATNGEAAIERRNRRRLENCLLRKRGSGEVDLLLLPYDDGDGFLETSLHQMYISNDLSDPIDSYDYENGYEDIIDECDGFPMLFMKSPWSSYDTVANVYFEYIRAYRNWEGELVTKYSWDVSDNVSVYGGNEYVKYFVDSADYELFVAYGPQASQIKKYNIETLAMGNGDVSKIKGVSFNGELPEDYKTGAWLQVGYNNGLYGLWYIGRNNDDIIKVIEKDVPYDNEVFELFNENGVCYIGSKTRKYYLSGDDTDDIKFHTIDRLENHDEFCIVYYDTNDHNQDALPFKYGLYDIETQELIIKGLDYISDYGECVLLDYGDYSIFYDYKNRRYASGKCTEVTRLRYTSLCGYVAEDGKSYRIFDTEKLTDHGPFEKIEWVYSNDNVLVKSDGVSKLYSVEHSKYVLPEGAVLQNEENLTEYLFVYELNGKKYLYASVFDETVLELSDPIEFVEFNKGTSTYSQTYSVKKSNGKYVIIGCFGEIFTKFDADSVIPAVNQGHKKQPNAIVRNGVVYFSYNNGVVRPKNGIPVENFLKYAIKTNSREDLPDVIIGIVIGDGRYKVTYSPYYNQVNSVVTADDVNVTDQNILSNIEKLFFPEKAQIAEQFKNIIDRMDIL